MELTNEQIHQYLIDTGWELKSTEVIEQASLDPQDNQPADKYRFTVAVNGCEITGEYTKGIGHRVWCDSIKIDSMKHGPVSVNDKKAFGYKPGEMINLNASHFAKKTLFGCEVFRNATQPSELTLVDIVGGLQWDAGSIIDAGGDFSEWAEMLGYSDDSISAKRLFDECLARWQAMTFAGVDIEALREKFQDY